MIEKNIIKYGDFTLKSGEKSNVYINIKELNNYHNILSLACVLLYNKFKNFFLNVNLCGVPYGGISIATLLSNLSKTGIILLRKEPIFLN
jgi:orotate phosphoribosyltransferase